MLPISSTTKAAISPALTAAHPKPDADHGTPLYSQHDPRWSHRTLGRHYTVGNAGCAMTAMAMAISKISGHPITPGQLDHWNDQHHGYFGDNLIWENAGRAGGLTAIRPKFSLDAIDRNLKHGRPVVIGVDYKSGGIGVAN